MQSKESIQNQLDKIRSKYGEWTFDITLPYGIIAKGVIDQPYTRLKRIVQMANDLCKKPLADCKVLDLGCLNGLFSIEFAQHGASVLGIEIREANIEKAKFCKEVLELNNLEFVQDDVRNISVEKYGKFDIIVCSGILYHLPAVDAINLIRQMFDMVEQVVIIDTHTALEPVNKIEYEGREYWGWLYKEHDENTSAEQREKSLWASADNTTSFWFTRPSLINIMNGAGFSSVYECFTPIHIKQRDRSTFAALKGLTRNIVNSPSVNELRQEFSETALTYAKTAEEIENAMPFNKLVKMILFKIRNKLCRFLDKDKIYCDDS